MLQIQEFVFGSFNISAVVRNPAVGNWNGESDWWKCQNTPTSDRGLHRASNERENSGFDKMYKPHI